MKKIKIPLIVVVFLAFANVVLAQRELYNWQLTPYIGLLQVDKNINLPEDVNQFAYGIRLDKRISSDFTIGLNLANLYLGDTTNRNITGVFLSVGYNWDNGYLLSDRAFISPFHRLEGGYANRYSSLEDMSEKNSDFGFGIENGIKLRFGDRITADVAFALFASKSNLTEGDIKKNVHYNVWRIGLSYFFGNRKSTYVAPVFVPRNDLGSTPNKIHPKVEDRWIVEDSVYNEKVKVPEKKDLTPPVSPKIKDERAKADSIQIFMHFDSLYIRRDRMDELIEKFLNVDSLHHKDSVFTTKIKPVVPDTLREFWFTPIDSLREKQLPLHIQPNSSKQDTTTYFAPAHHHDVRSQSLQTLKEEEAGDETRAVAAPLPTQRDTIFMEGRVDTVYVQKETTAQPPAKNAKANDKNPALEKEVKSQKAEIDRLEKEVQRLRNDRDNDTGKILGAGAAGAVIGAAGKDNKSEKDTGYVNQSQATTARIDSLEKEIAALKAEKSSSDSTRVSTYIPQPPIGKYFSEEDSSATLVDSLQLDSDSLGFIFPDSTHQMVDEAMAELDTLSPSNEVMDDFIEDPENTGERDSEKESLKTTEIDGNKEVVRVDSETPELKGSYPIICNFDLNRSTPTDEELQKLDVVIKDLKANKNRKVVLTGFTDKSGNADYNLKLSAKRAGAIQSHLVAHGIAQDRIEINAGGILDSADKYSPNARRVEVEIVEN